MTSLDDVSINTSVTEHSTCILDAFCCYDNRVLLCDNQADPARLQPNWAACLARPAGRQFFTQERPQRFMLRIHRCVADGAHVRGHEAIVAVKLPLHDLADLGPARRDRYRVKVDISLLGAVGDVDARVVRRGRAQPLSRQALDEPLGQQAALHVGKAAAPGNVRGTHEAAGADERGGPQQVGVVRGKGGGNGTAQREAQDMKCGRAGPRKR